MMTSLQLDPLVPWFFWFALSGVCFVGILVGVIRHLRGWPWRMVSLVILLLALLQPSLVQQEREYLEDIVIILEDKSSSQTIRGRSEQSYTTAQALEEMLTNRNGVKVRRVSVADGEDNSGTRMIQTLKRVLAEEPRAQIAGIITITDGQVHDLNMMPDLPAPLHVFLSLMICHYHY